MLAQMDGHRAGPPSGKDKIAAKMNLGCTQGLKPTENRRSSSTQRSILMMRFTSTLALAASLTLLSLGAQAAAPSNWPCRCPRQLRQRLQCRRQPERGRQNRQSPLRMRRRQDQRGIEHCRNQGTHDQPERQPAAQKQSSRGYFVLQSGEEKVTTPHDQRDFAQ